MTLFSIKNLAQKTHDVAPVLASLDTALKNKVILAMAEELTSHGELIMKENQVDLQLADEAGLSKAMKDRLLINEKRIHEMSNGLKEVAHLPDPVGQVIKAWERPNGLRVKRVRIPLGVIGVVYESRPNVTVDAAGLCFKSGNAIILRGGKEAFHSNMVLGKILQDVLRKNHLPVELITVVPSTDREVLKEMITLVGLIDLMIPRGGDSLMKFMTEHSKIPVVKHDKGVCNLFVDESADISMAVRIIENSKVQRPGVCNALENLFVHEKIAEKFLPPLAHVLIKDGVEIRGDEKVRALIPSAKKATEQDWQTEYLDLILSIKIVQDIHEAILLIRRYGSLHTESIVTNNQANAEQFVKQLDSSCVLVNASTRFNDGGQLGLGAEIGISTTKLHAFGPMGLEELTTSKFVVQGEGQIRT